jgi:A/G-specific adenine glycosylase
MYDHLWHSLLEWYGRARRDLPWRRSHDAYAILVAETMLQQTGVERVIPKYLAFLERWPTIRDLSSAATGDVIRLWSGLGYNRRAVWLQKAARLAIERWDGLPATVDELQSLPGIGPYTARAVACFAFGVQTAVLDTNVKRVLRRLVLPSDADPSDKRMWALAGEVLPPGRAYDWNQALMDLGAVICTHAAPRCLLCPLSESCRAYPVLLSPGAHRQLAIAEPRPRWKEEPFVGSRRYYRGRVVEILRGLPAGRSMSFAEVGASVKGDFGDGDVLWLESLVEDLAREGLVHVADGALSLPA